MRKIRALYLSLGAADALLSGCGQNENPIAAVSATHCEGLAGFVSGNGELIYLSEIDVDAAIPACAQAHQNAPDDLSLALYLIRAMDAAEGDGDNEKYAPKIKEILDSLGEDETGALDYVRSILHLRGAMGDIDYDAYFEAMQSAYNKGFVWAKDGLSNAYYSGDGTQQDHYKSHELILEGADTGLAHFNYEAGLNYDFGYGIAENNVLAVEHYRRAAAHGHPSALNNLGAKYEIGEGVKRDLDLAFSYFQKSHDAGSEWGTCNLGEAYSNGEGVAQDVDRAAELFESAAERGHATCMAWHAWAFKTGNGQAKDYVMARHWARLAANENEEEGHGILGELYQNGWGVKKDMAKAFTAYEAGAQLGQILSQAELGELFEKGVGTDKNMDEAIFWYKKAADQGNNWSRNRLGEIYRFGSSVDQDLNLSLDYFFAAADEDYSNAVQNLRAFQRAHGNAPQLSAEHKARLNVDDPDWD